MFSEVFLAVWSCAGLIWWALAWSLAATNRLASGPVPDTGAARKLTVFKPLPPLDARGLKLVSAGIESFVAQLDSASEMLLGIHEADRDRTAPFLKRLRAEYPCARLKVVFRSEPDDAANPKVVWQRILSREAEGDLWLWSDADILAPPGFLRSACLEYARGSASMITFPYVIGNLPSPPALLEALFVNVEFYPGVLLLRHLGPVDFGLGAAMLFQRDDFLRQIDWNEIEVWLADDFFLGQRLQPVRIGAATLATVPSSATWKEAVLHDLRWTKTIRWNRPIGSFSRILILPVLGWLGAVLLYPAHPLAWVGLFCMIQADVFFAAAICRQAGCRLGWEHLPGLEAWSLWRIALWILSWIPWPVFWSGKMWRGPRTEVNRETELEST